MKQFIEFNTYQSQPSLRVSSRKRYSSTFFFMVKTGGILIHVGKKEYLVSCGQQFWIPSDCLHSVTILPNTHFYQIRVSIRATENLPQQVGYTVENSLVNSLCDTLKKTEEETLAYRHLLLVLNDQLKLLSPTLVNPLMINGIKNNESTDIAALVNISTTELKACLLMREAVRLSRSGKKIDQIANQLNMPIETLQELSKSLLSESL